MHVDEFEYELPEDAIAQTPLDDRPAARLLVSLGESVEHRTVRELPDLVGPGDLIVINDTRVIPARLRARRPTGGAAEVLLLEELDDDRWEALVRPSRRISPGTELTCGDELVVVVHDDLGAGRRLVEIRSDRPVLDAIGRVGEMPLPPYITVPLDDPDRYQTVYAQRPASAAAPTAGLHLTDDVLDACRRAGARVATVELIVGLDTFRPIGVDDLDAHEMHSERYRVPVETWEACAAADRVIAIGTTAVRALESAAATGELSGRTRLFIRRPYEFRIVDVLLTNFHLPRSTLLVMLDAFAGPGWRALYEEAIASGYRMLSFGDAMLVDRARPQ